MKTSIRIFKLLLVFLSTLLFTIVAHADVNLDSMKIDEYKVQLTELQQKTNLTAEEKQDKDDITAIIDILEKYNKTKSSYEEVTNELNSGHKTIQDFKKKKENLEKKYVNGKLPDLSKKDFNSISNMYREALAQKDKTSQLYNDENKKIININAISDYAQKKSVEFQEKIDNDKNILTGAEVRKLEETKLTAEIKYLEYYMQFLQFLNISHNKLQEICTTRLEYYRYKFEQEQRLVDYLNTAIEEINKDALLKEEERLQKETAEFEISDSERSELSDSLVEENRIYRESIADAIRNITIYTAENGRVAKFLEATNKIEADVNSQIDTFAGSLFLSQMLAKQKKSIPEYYAAFNVDETIGSLRMEQYDVNARLSELENIPELIKNSKPKSKKQIDLTEEQMVVIAKLFSQQSKLLTRYKEKLSMEVNLLVNIKMKYSLYVKSRQNIYNTINKKVFWLQSNQKMNLSWLKNLPSMLKKEISGASIYFSADHFLHSLNSHLPKLLLLMLISLIILLKRPSIDQQIVKFNKKVGSYRHDLHVNSFITMLLTMIRVFYWPLMVVAICKIISYFDLRIGVYDVGEIAVNVRFRLALIAFFAAFFKHAMSEGGIFPEHFAIHTPKKLISKHMSFLAVLGILCISCTNKDLYPNTIATDVIAEIFFFIILLFMQYILLSWLRAVFKNPNSNILERSFCICFSFIPAILIVELLLGYFYSVVKVTEKLIDTYFIVLCISLIYRLILRSLSITSRRLAFQRKIEERDQKRKEKKDAEKGSNEHDDLASSIEVDEIMPVSDISKQAISIVNISVLTIGVLILYFVWSDFITILSYIDSISLWSISDKDPSTGAIIVKKITMGNLLISIYSLIMTILVVKNLPGLLEITILNRFTATRNVSYSIKTLLTYIILAFGLSFMLSELGITWDELQWLVAALSVGLGFGLQEIFGNFVSGIIILFERPIRLGDIVTIGGTTGVVTKIRIRATTIMDFNKRDLIVPNKTFITSQLTNWSLNDICLTRMILDVGVSYQEDANKVHDLLLDIAQRCKYVMKSPQPYVLFTSFGDSNLNFQLRFYINSIKDYNPSIDTINSEIYRRFKENGIEIAYNQMEVFIKNTQSGQEIKLNNDPKPNPVTGASKEATN